MECVPFVRRLWLGTTSLALAAMLIVPRVAAGSHIAAQSDSAVKAAFLYNFAKFAEWTALPAGAPIVLCIVGDNEVAAALVQIVRGQTIGGHPISIERPEQASSWRTCQLVFLPAAELRRGAERLAGLKALPVLTVSDSKDFAQSDGIIELYVDDGRVRFAINVDALERSGLRLSSRLLGLAKVIRDRHVQ